MSNRKPVLCWLALALVGPAFACAPGDGDAGEAADETIPAETIEEAASNPRFGAWELESDAEPPVRNVMTYEPWGDGGMKITVAQTNSDGETSEWSYATMFDGVFREVEGQENATTSVEVIDERTNHIFNARNGLVYQVIVNVLSEDGNTINNEYRRTGADGTERVSHAVYRRIQ